DVDGDGFIVATDALIIVNRINSGVNTQLPEIPFGELPDYYYDTNGDGFCTAADVLLIADRLNASNSPPILAAALANDTGPGGIPNSDGVTSDPTIAGQVSDAGPLVFFTATLNDFAEPVSIRNLVQPNGSFALTASTLEILNDGPLADGAYTVRLTAVNELGFVTSQTITMSLDKGILTPPVPVLDAASDTGVSNSDNITRVNTPTIRVAAEVGSTVTLFVNGAPLAQTQVASPLAVFAVPELPDGVHQLTAEAVDGAGNLSSLSPALSLTIRTVAPSVEMITVPYMDDLTPLVPVVVTAAPAITNGTPVFLDIDRNNDGDYDDEDETGAAEGVVYNGNATLVVKVALDEAETVDGYPIRTRARIVDEAGNEGIDERVQIVSTVTSTALRDYVTKEDSTYGYTFVRSFEVNGVTAHVFEMRSQTWRTPAEVNHTEWRHWVTIMVPSGLPNKTALLNISGGSYNNSAPTAQDSEIFTLSGFAYLTQSVVVSLKGVPNQPLEFTDDLGNNRSEDAIIAYSYDKFLEDPADTEWPVLLAMVKSAVKAMDTTQSFISTLNPTNPNYRVDEFVVTGASKRGWTTWLTPAADDRIKAIIPVVFDALNLDQQMLHHYGVYGFFSQAIKDYEDKNIFERILTENGAKLGAIIDPYHYLAQPNYDIPKYLVNSAGDEFFVSDSSQYYFDDLPGTQNYLRYVPNTGHGLNIDASYSVGAFYNAVIKNIPLPKFSWKILDNGAIQVTAADIPGTVTLWQTTNPVARDFRNQFTGQVWTSTPLANQGGGIYVGDVSIPATGATAFFIELNYFTSNFAIPNVGQIPFKFTTQIAVKTNLSLYDWPYEVADPVPLAPVGSLAAASYVGEGSLAEALQATAFAVSVGAEATIEPLLAAPLAAAPLEPVIATSTAREAARAAALAEVSSSAATALLADDDQAASSRLSDSIFDDELFDPADELADLLALL
ncbi:MAG: hypothetical protein JNG90_18020, partial [Planctomycetaceae bacterium]|nr:hypothetical protein [Planctomycetaceae bacterium]